MLGPKSDIGFSSKHIHNMNLCKPRDHHWTKLCVRSIPYLGICGVVVFFYLHLPFKSSKENGTSESAAKNHIADYSPRPVTLLPTKPKVIKEDPETAHQREHWQQMVKKYVQAPLNNTYGSHVVPLLASAYVTKGPMFEMGSGFFSTPMLSRIASEQSRFLLTADTDKEWLQKFTEYKSEFHNLMYVHGESGDGSEWEEVGNDRQWSLVFLDHRPGTRRGVDLRRFKKEADLIVAHDTEAQGRRGYQYDHELEKFKAWINFRHFGTHTTVVSDTHTELVDRVYDLVKWAIDVL